MQFTDFLFSTEKLFKPIICTFVGGLFFMILFSYVGNKIGWSQNVISKTTFISMAIIFVVVRYWQAKIYMKQYLQKKKRKIAKRESSD